MYYNDVRDSYNKQYAQLPLPELIHQISSLAIIETKGLTSPATSLLQLDGFEKDEQQMFSH